MEVFRNPVWFSRDPPNNRFSDIFQKRFCLQKYAPRSWLSNGENRRSLPCSYQKLFKKHPSALTSGADSSIKFLSSYLERATNSEFN